MLVHEVRPTVSASVRDIVVPMLNAAEDGVAWAAAESLAPDANTCLTALYVALLPHEIFAPNGNYLANPLTDIVTINPPDRERERLAISQRLCQSRATTKLTSIELDVNAALRALAAHARESDIAIMRRPDPRPRDVRQEIFEALLFDSGRPVIIVPPGWDGGLRAGKVIIGWNGSREAARAVADAMPWLSAAHSVDIVTIDRPRSADEPHMAGGIREHLSRRDIHAELIDTTSKGRSDGEALLAEARVSGADLIVVGGFGRPRAMEMLLGGVTRHVMTHADRPVLLSR
jgi:nucleotide-binding universal stress UspA family protein